MDKNELSHKKSSIGTITERKRNNSFANHNIKRFCQTNPFSKQEMPIFQDFSKYKVIKKVRLILLK
jgi:hypothetical protein